MILANHSKGWDAKLLAYVLIQGARVAGLPGDPLPFSNSGKRASRMAKLVPLIGGSLMSNTAFAAGATAPRQSRSRKKAQPAEKRLTAKVGEKLIDTYLPLIWQMADRVHGRLPRHRIELASLTQSGVVGLLEAAQRHDEGPGVAFQD